MESPQRRKYVSFAGLVALTFPMPSGFQNLKCQAASFAAVPCRVQISEGTWDIIENLNYRCQVFAPLGRSKKVPTDVGH